MINDLIQANIENALCEIHTGFPAQILVYDEDKQCADIQPLLKKKLKDDSVLSMPVIHNVPVVFPAGGGALLSFPVEKGDIGFVMCAERSIDAWKSSDGGQIDPEDSRKFNLSDAVFFIGLNPFSKNLHPEKNCVCLKYKDSKISIKDDSTLTLFSKASLNIEGGDNIVIHSAKSIQIKSDATLKIESDKVEFLGDIQCKNISCTELKAQSEVMAGAVSLTKHIHISPAGTQGGPTSVPQ